MPRLAATAPLRARAGHAPSSRIAVALATAVLAILGVPAAASATPTLAGSFTDATQFQHPTSVAVAGQYAYTTLYDTGQLAAVDISNPTHPVVAGVNAAPTSGQQNNMYNAVTVNVAGGYAYVASKNRNASSTNNDDGTGNSLTILDIHSDPAHPAVVGTVRDAVKLFGAYGVQVSGNYAYIAAQGCLSGQPCPNTSVGDRFVVVDISDRSNPTIVAQILNTTSGALAGALRHACAVAVSGNYAYVTAAYQHRLTVINIANPLNPQITGVAADAQKLPLDADVDVAGNYAYVAVQSSGVARLTVVDVSNKSAPVVAASVQSSAALDGAYRVRVRGTSAYVASAYSNAIARVNVSDPLHPRLSGYVNQPGAQSQPPLGRPEGVDLDATGRYAFSSSTGSASFATIDLFGPPPSISIQSASKPPATTTQRTASFSFSTNDPLATTECRLDTGSFSPCTSATTQQYNELADGQHSFTVRAVDGAGQGSSPPASYTWTVYSTQTGAPPGALPPAEQPAQPSTEPPTQPPSLDPDRAARAIAAKLRSLGLRGLRHKRSAVVQVSATGPGNLIVKVTATAPKGASGARARRTLLATAQRKTGAAGVTVLRLRLTRAGIKLLRSRPRALVLTIRAAAQGSHTAVRTTTVR